MKRQRVPLEVRATKIGRALARLQQVATRYDHNVEHAQNQTENLVSAAVAYVQSVQRARRA